MAENEAAAEAQSREVLRTRVQAWWLSVLAGQASDDHPVQGSKIKAEMDGGTLVLSGAVSSEADLRDLQAELEHLRGHGVSEVRNEITVEPEAEDEPGLLVQTLMATFETEELAGFAAGYLEGHAHIRPGLVKVISPKEGDAGAAQVHALLPEAYWEDAEAALTADRTLLIVTVDETEAFKTRELLDEETQSLETVTLPPAPAGGLNEARGAARDASAVKKAGHTDEQVERGRREALRREDAIHGA